MNRPDFPDYTDILVKRGQPFKRCGKHAVNINTSFFAEYFFRQSPLKNFDGLGFVRWSGGWQTLEEAPLLNELETLTAEIALDFDLKDELRISENDFAQIVKVLKRRAWEPGRPKPDPDIIPAANLLLRWNEQLLDFEVNEYSPGFFILSRFPVAYDPDATAPQFDAVLQEIIPDPEDRRVAQEYLGAALFFVNLTRKFLLCYGEGGCGKSVLILFLTKLLGAFRVFDLNIENVKHDYELAGLTTQTLLTASEAASRALCSDGAEWVKKAVGGDFFQTKQKFCNAKTDHHGTFSLVIVSNNRLQFQYEGRGDEWRDRVIPIFFDHHIPDERRDLGLVDRLMEEEGPGIFNWFLEGARLVRRNNWKIELSPIQRDRIERLLALSNPMTVFVQNHVRLCAGKSITSSEAWVQYLAVREKTGLPLLEEAAFYKRLATAMAEVYQAAGVNSLPGKQRGYRGFELV